MSRVQECLGLISCILRALAVFPGSVRVLGGGDALEKEGGSWE